MTIFVKMLPVLIASQLFVSIALTGDLKNEDSKRYEVRVHGSSTTTNTWIDGNTTGTSICSDCEIEVVGVGRMRLKGSEKLVIKGGKLTKQ